MPKHKPLLMAFNRGRSAFGLGQPVSACPYPAAAEYKAAWERGWFEQQRRFNRSHAKLKREIETLRKP